MHATLITGIASAVALTATPAFANFTVFVDNFTEGEVDEFPRLLAGDLLDASAVVPNVLGGFRGLTAEIIENSDRSRLELSAALGAAEEDLFRQGLGIGMGPNLGAVIDLTYDANGAGLGFDLAELEPIALELHFETVDLETEVAITLGDGGTEEVFITTIGPLTSPNSLLVGIDEFAGVDFSNLESVNITLNGDGATDRDLLLNSISFEVQIPSPATATLAAMGGLAFARRRR